MEFKDHILDLLSDTAYSLDLKPNQLSSLEGHSDLKSFTEWFVLNVSKENCITPEELDEFNKLQDNEEVLYGKDLDEALQAYHEQPLHSLVPYVELSCETKCDELAHVKEQLRLKENLHSSVRLCISSTTDDMCKIHSELRKAEGEQTDVLKKIFTANKCYNSKLKEMKIILDSLQENLSELDVGNEVSPDKGIGTLLSDEFDTASISDKLNTSMLSTTSTLSLLSACGSDKGSKAKFICQVPFQKHDKIQSNVWKVLDNIIQKDFPKIELVMMEDNKMDELELQNIMKRLFYQKQSLIKNTSTLEGIMAARNKIKEVYHDIQNQTWKQTQLKLREFIDFEEEETDLDESFVSDFADLIDACNKWAEFQTLKPVWHRLEEKMELAIYFLDKVDEIIRPIQLKVVADTLLYDLLNYEVDRVEQTIQLYTSVQDDIRQKLNNTTKRLEIMAANLEDYYAYCSLPVEERNELSEWLASILGSDKNGIVEAVNLLNGNCQQHHEQFSQLIDEELQTCISVEQEMKNFYNEEMQKGCKTQQPYSELFESLQRMLDEMCVEIQDTICHCSSIQRNVDSIQDRTEVQDMLKKLMQQ